MEGKGSREDRLLAVSDPLEAPVLREDRDVSELAADDERGDLEAGQRCL